MSDPDKLSPIDFVRTKLAQVRRFQNLDHDPSVALLLEVVSTLTDLVEALAAPKA